MDVLIVNGVRDMEADVKIVFHLRQNVVIKGINALHASARKMESVLGAIIVAMTGGHNVAFNTHVGNHNSLDVGKSCKDGE